MAKPIRVPGDIEAFEWVVELLRDWGATPRTIRELEMLLELMKAKAYEVTVKG